MHGYWKLVVFQAHYNYNYIFIYLSIAIYV